MKSLVNKLVLVALAVVIALPLAAADKEKKKKGAGAPGAIGQLKKKLSSVELTAEQQKKVDEVFAQFGPKLAEAAKAAGDAPKLVQAAKKAATDAGKKGKEVAEAVKAVKLSPEQQAAMEKFNSLNQEVTAAIAAILTDDQKAKADIKVGGGKKKKKGA